MKNIFISILFSISACLFAQEYKISEINYDITGSGLAFMGTTRIYALEKNVPVDKNKVFNSIDEINEYVSDYSLRLNNTRAFESVNVDYELKDSDIILNVVLKDSFHMIAIPYGRYDSNKGLVFKLKFKDTNFLGTLSPLTTDLNFIIEQPEDNSDPDYKVGFNFVYDYPFKTGIFDSKWTNNYAFSYTFGDSSPEWNLNTGLSFSLPFNNYSLVLDLSQGFVKNFDYLSFNDELYFTETAKFSVPVDIYSIENWGTIVYSPYLTFSLNWDFDGIDISNTALSSPKVTLGQSLSTSRVNWINNLRKGIDISFNNYYDYNFQRNMLYPVVTLDLKGYTSTEFFEANYLNRIGLNTNLYAFAYLMDYQTNPYLSYDGIKIGERLRGIRDELPYKTGDLGSACTTPAALVLNLDVPFRLFETNFTYSFFKYLNFDLQVSPFIDAALTYNKCTNKWFDPKDGFYTAGVEFLVFPKKLSSFTVRGSLGVDIGKKLFSEHLNTEWRADVSPYELFIGVGVLY